MGEQKIFWTDELRAQVVHLYRTEGQSATQIAEALGPDFTRNMVLGQLLKMGQMRTGKNSKGKYVRAKKEKKVLPTYEYRPPVKLPPVDSVWSMSDDDRRRVFAVRAARAARQMLESMKNG